MEKKSRRTFIRLVNTGLIALFLLFWNKLTINHIELKEPTKKAFPLNKNKLVSFYGNYIVINQKDKITVFSSHCTHLGCKINTVKDNKLICPCHGSEYNLEGKIIKGPSYKNLVKIPIQVSSDKTTIEINS
jgi:cytochrome b6-f complex iron-sulfur subunit